MKSVLALLLVPTPAIADGAHPEELFLGDAAWLQEQAELQVTAMPSWQRDRWELGGIVEYGITRRFQLAAEGSWTDGPQMDVLREAEIGALFAPYLSERVVVAVGASASTERTIEPMVSAAVLVGDLGANLAVSTEIGDEAGPSIALGVFARIGRILPILEGSFDNEQVTARAGCAVQVGDFQLAAAVGIGPEQGVSAHAALTWAIELADGDDDKAP